MMRRNAIETLLGGIVLAVAVVFLFVALKSAQVGGVQGYEIKAVFYKIGGLTNGSDVRINGIKVGTVIDSRLNPKTFDAEVRFTLRRDVKLPDDTIAVIASEGLVGNKYVRLDPGMSQNVIAPGGVIKKTKDFRSLEDQVGEIIFLATGGSEQKGK
ncbi:MAG: outer membrane lipid asymmetry maintenance protein MlaD [Rhodospirillales bacterium]